MLLKTGHTCLYENIDFCVEIKGLQNDFFEERLNNYSDYFLRK